MSDLPVKYVINKSHYDDLAKQFGDISISVRYENETIRLSKLTDKKEILRTFAITIFSTHEYSTQLLAVHKEVEKGLPIGKTILKQGFNLIRGIKATFKIDKPAMFEGDSTFTYGQLSEIYIGVENEKEYYATVCEIFCPTFGSSSMANNYKNQAISDQIRDLLTLANISTENIVLTN